MAVVLLTQIDKTDGRPARLTRHPRIRVAQIVMDYMAHGWSPEELCRRLPHITPAEVHAAMAYYYDHSEEIESEIRRETEATRAARAAAEPTPFERRMKNSGNL